MTPRLIVNGRDLSPYMQLQHDDGLDPSPAGFEPQFANSPAFSEGAEFVSDAIGNREWTIPLALSAANRANLHKLIEDINAELAEGSQVEFASDSADASTYFNLERGRLDATYQYFLTAVNSVSRATLKLWTRPFGDTGTAVTVASLGATTAIQFPATGILGDVNALANLEVRVGSKVASGGRVIGYGIHSSASFNGILGPSAPNFVAQSGATVRGYSGAVGSQALALPVSPTGASGVALTAFLTPPGGYVGRHRLLAIGRSRLDRAISLYAKDRFGAVLGPTTAASVIDANKWGLIDLGEIQVPVRDPRQEAVPTQYFELYGGGASGASVVASPAFEVNRLIVLPLDVGPGIMRTPGADGNSVLYSDTFTRLKTPGRLRQYPNTEVGGGVWDRIMGDFGVPADYSPGFIAPMDNGLDTVQPNASGFYSLASGAALSDVRSFVLVGLSQGQASQAAASTVVELFPKLFSAASNGAGATMLGFSAKWQFGPSQSVQLISYSAAGASVMASAGIASTLASGIYVGAYHWLTVQAFAGELAVWIATGALAASPIIAASHADITRRGWPALRGNVGSNVATGRLAIDRFTHYTLGVGASDMGPREWFRFEGYPLQRAFQGNASTFLVDQVANLRGVAPQLLPQGSPAPSGPQQVVVLSGDPTDFLGNDLLDVRLDVNARFRFLR